MKMIHKWNVWIALFSLSMTGQGAGAAEWRVTPQGELDYQVWRDGAPAFTLSTSIVGPQWSRAVTSAKSQAAIGKRSFTDRVRFSSGQQGETSGEPLSVHLETSVQDDQTLLMRHVFQSAKDAELIGVGYFIRASDYLSGGKVILTGADGKAQESPLPPPGLGNYGKGLKSVVLQAANGERIECNAQPGVSVTRDKGQLRIWTLADSIAGGKPVEATLALRFPGPVVFEAANRWVDTSNWFPFVSTNDFTAPSVIGMQEWLDAPAGKHGWVRIQNDQFVFEDGTPVKFWGINIGNQEVAAPKHEADQWADKCAKYGINLMRWHKFLKGSKLGFGGKGVMRNDDATLLDEEQFGANMDYFHAALKKRGVYIGWSPIYAHRLSPADKARMLPGGYDEIMKIKHNLGFFNTTTLGFVNFAPDIQDIYIAIVTHVLNRKNTVTGLRYAEDPAIAYIELQNEDDIFFPGYDRLVAQSPVYKRYIDAEFSKWLKQNKYASQEALAKAWGATLKKGENLEQGTVAAFENWNRLGDGSRRTQDSYQFLYERQDSFYKRYVKAIRDTGYQGAICGSCWQAATFLGHLYNVRSDREVGYIDRHNYGKGGGTMLDQPGSGLLSAGFQAVSDRPFGLSEWAGGGLWAAESVPIIGIYGMGLQGWDLSAHFASGSPVISSQASGAACDQLINISQYPAIARMLFRGDIKEGDVVARRRVSIPAMADNAIGFNEAFSLLGAANIKDFSSVAPQASLGAGRVVLEFVDGPVAKPVEESVRSHLNTEKRVVRSTTGQLHWDYSQRGWFTVNTPGTQAVIGFGGGREHRLSDCVIQTDNAFANVYVNSLDPGKPISQARALVITTVARMVDKGTVFDELSDAPVERPGRNEAAPLLIEPVQASITLKRTDPCRVLALDHEGRKPAQTVEMAVDKTPEGQRLVLDGAKSKTIYYVVEFGDGTVLSEGAGSGGR